jgi:hypothetical protein
MKTLRFGAILAMVAATTFACSGDDDDTAKDAAAGAPSSSNTAGAPADDAGGASAMAPLEIIGVYDDSFMGVQTITADDWNGAKIVGYDNDANIVYTQAPADDMFNPSKFGKTVYTEPKNGSFYFCMVEFALDTLADAEASVSTADDSDPDNTGCGGDFPWTKATKQ